MVAKGTNRKIISHVQQARPVLICEHSLLSYVIAAYFTARKILPLCDVVLDAIDGRTLGAKTGCFSGW
jgi:hypothetical protein